MNNLEKHVTSLELSKRLKELNLKQESEFYWVAPKSTMPNGKIGNFELKNIHIKNINTNYYVYYSAFLSSEIGEMLPFNVEFGLNYPNTHSSDCIVCLGKDDPRYYCCYDDFDKHEVNFDDNVEANARAKMLIYLIETEILI